MPFSCSVAASDAEIADCFPVMQQLRPQLTESDWVARVRRMEDEGYRLLAARDAGAVVGVAGFRIFECIARGGRSRPTIFRAPCSASVDGGGRASAAQGRRG